MSRRIALRLITMQRNGDAMYCKNCKAELEPEALFCQDCGTPVKGAARKQDTEPSPSERPESDEGFLDEQADQSRKRRYSVPEPISSQPGQANFKPADIKAGKGRMPARTIAIGVICVAVVIAVGFAAAVLLGLKGPFSSGGDASSSSAASASSTSSASSASSASAASEAASDSSSASSKSAKSSKSSSSSKKSSEASADKSEATFDQAKAESKARNDAQAAGMQVFMGTVHITTYGQRADEVDSKLAKSVANVAYEELALLEFSMDEDVTALAAGNQYVFETRYGQECLSLANPWNWEAYDNQLITVAAYPDDLVFPYDAASRLYSAVGNVELIAPLDEERAASLTFAPQGTPYLVDIPEVVDEPSKSSESSKRASGDYVLPESDTRTYSKSEIEDLSDYELYIARNEIFARHGRIFQNDDLQDYFESKSWYHGTSSASNNITLNADELANAATIREVEQARNSKYL